MLLGKVGGQAAQAGQGRRQHRDAPLLACGCSCCPAGWSGGRIGRPAAAPPCPRAAQRVQTPVHAAAAVPEEWELQSGQVLAASACLRLILPGRTPAKQHPAAYTLHYTLHITQPTHITPTCMSPWRSTNSSSSALTAVRSKPRPAARAARFASMPSRFSRFFSPGGRQGHQWGSSDILAGGSGARARPEARPEQVSGQYSSVHAGKESC